MHFCYYYHSIILLKYVKIMSTEQQVIIPVTLNQNSNQSEDGKARKDLKNILEVQDHRNKPILTPSSSGKVVRGNSVFKSSAKVRKSKGWMESGKVESKREYK